jgi:peptidoglycan-N-acetylglucosamine deacetylase
MIFTPFHDGIRRLENRANVYLTFDDGPVLDGTPQVLNALAKAGAQATFFVVADRAKKHPEIIREILNSGHSVGNHSGDHGYRAFFAPDEALKKWIVESEDVLCQILGRKPVGFRPPAGIVTPPLVRVLRQLKLPMYLWSHRFFDSYLGFRPWLSQISVNAIRGGEIILLHDAQKSSQLPVFLKTLDIYLEAIKNRGYSFVHL